MMSKVMVSSIVPKDVIPTIKQEEEAILGQEGVPPQALGGGGGGIPPGAGGGIPPGMPQGMPQEQAFQSEMPIQSALSSLIPYEDSVEYLPGLFALGCSMLVLTAVKHIKKFRSANLKAKEVHEPLL